MCENCGCSDDFKTVTSVENKHEHPHSHGHFHAHVHEHEKEDQLDKKTGVLKSIFDHNQIEAERNRGFFEAKKTLVINLVSSPGSGKTSLLEKTINELKDKKALAVIEGNGLISSDDDRFDRIGVKFIRLKTDMANQLQAGNVNEAVKKLDIIEDSILFIENVDNLSIPLDLGESIHVVMISVTEGDNKPDKYPQIFSWADICIISKIDLLPYVDCNSEKIKKVVKNLNPQIQFFEISVKKNEGVNQWIQWLKEQKNNIRAITK